VAIARKITDLAELTAAAAADVLVIVDDPAGAAATKKITVENLLISTIQGKTASYTLVLSDAGQTIRFTGATASKVLTIPANSVVAFTPGTLIRVHNDGSVNMTVVITTDTLTWAEDNTTGTRTLAPGASCEIQKVAATDWKIDGSTLVT